MKLITFSLWGDNPKYCKGALRNAELALEVYPGWVCRFYIDRNTVPSKYWDELEAMPNTECVDMPLELSGWRGMFSRFLAASEPNVDVFISRDCDSRLSKREMNAVQDWIISPRQIHIMRDHPHHTVPILGGLWGAKVGAIPDMTELINKWTKEDRWQTDQDFLKTEIWPKHFYKAMVHDDWHRFAAPAVEMRKFPTIRHNKDFVGSIVGPNEENLHPEHHEML